MHAHGWSSAEVVSSPSHLGRSALILATFNRRQPALALTWRTHPALGHPNTASSTAPSPTPSKPPAASTCALRFRHIPLPSRAVTSTIHNSPSHQSLPRFPTGQKSRLPAYNLTREKFARSPASGPVFRTGRIKPAAHVFCTESKASSFRNSDLSKVPRG